MARKATFASKNAKPNSSAHNSRRSVPKYLIETDPDFDKNFYEKMDGYETDLQFRELAKMVYKQKINQKMQSRQIKALIKEVVITVTDMHTSDDIIALFDSLREMAGGGYHLLELAGHYDEGHFVRTEEGWSNLPYYPSKDILLKDDGKWYIKSNELLDSADQSNFDQLANMSNYKKIHNLHYHAKFTNMDLSTGKTVRLTKYQVSGEGRLKHVAKFLGLRYAPNERKYGCNSVNSIKDRHHAHRQEGYQQILKMTQHNIEYRTAIKRQEEDRNAAYQAKIDYDIEKAENARLEEYGEYLENEIISLKKNENIFIAQINKILSHTGLPEISSVTDLDSLDLSNLNIPISKEEVGIASSPELTTEIENDFIPGVIHP